MCSKQKEPQKHQGGGENNHENKGQEDGQSKGVRVLLEQRQGRGKRKNKGMNTTKTSDWKNEHDQQKLEQRENREFHIL